MNENNPSTGPVPVANGRQTRDQPSNADVRDWYYRHGERERGPMTRSQLTDLVASSGDLAREIVVKQHADGEWIPYEAIDAATSRRLHADRETRPAQDSVAHRGAAAAPAPPNAIRRRPSLRDRLRGEWRIVIGVLAWACVNLALWFALDPFHRTERNYFDKVAKAAEQARDAREKGLDGASRGRIAAAVMLQIKPVVDELKQTASASEPIRQHLLLAARDQLPGLFSADGKAFAECDGIFQRHLYEAGRRLGLDVPLPESQVTLR
jgi:hypothetical protein